MAGRDVLSRAAVLLKSLFGPPAAKLAPPDVVGRIKLLHTAGDIASSGDRWWLTPMSRTFGFDRGTPVDRYYIERFLAENAAHIRGRVLEVGNNAYTRRFGGASVVHSDVLHVDATNPEATYIGSLEQGGVLPERTFDCIVLTQTLHLIFDMRAAIATLHNALKPGGVLLLTTPGISQVDSGEWGETWYWSLTATALRRLLAERFNADAVTIEVYGNVFAATTFLYGAALEEVGPENLDTHDPSYPVIVAAHALRSP
jgi:SAM-dependent methyltransferase